MKRQGPLLLLPDFCVMIKMDFKKLTFSDLPYIFDSREEYLFLQLANNAREVTRQYFGRTISLYAPLYISNYCENECSYCGFQVKTKIDRGKLSLDEIEKECKTLSKTGIQNILILTGESRAHSPVSYIKDAVIIAKKYFPNISLEVNPLETDEYKELFLAGADGVTVYQETYDKERYDKLHISGRKKDYKYRV